MRPAYQAINGTTAPHGSSTVSHAVPPCLLFHKYRCDTFVLQFLEYVPTNTIHDALRYNMFNLVARDGLISGTQFVLMASAKSLNRFIMLDEREHIGGIVVSIASAIVANHGFPILSWQRYHIVSRYAGTFVPIATVERYQYVL